MRSRRAGRLAPFALGFLTGAVSLYVALYRSGGLAPPHVSERGASSAPATAPADIATPPPATAPLSPLPGNRTDEPMNPFAPPLDLTRSHAAPVLSDFAILQERHLALPVEGFDFKRLRDDFAEKRGEKAHEAIDMPAPRGTAVVAVDDGKVVKLFNSVRGGLTVYQFDPAGQYCYYYAHLDRYAEGLGEGQSVRKGERIGYVGTSGNAPPQTPHLHFTIFKLGPEKRWWEGTPVNPFPFLR